MGLYGYGPWPSYGYGPYSQTVPPTPQMQPSAQNGPQIPQVHGEEGAKAYSLPPNSSILLMDQTDAVIWAKVTDGAGYATLKGFRITPIEEVKAPEPKEEPIYVTTKEFDALKEKVDKLLSDLGGDKA